MMKTVSSKGILCAMETQSGPFLLLFLHNAQDELHLPQPAGDFRWYEMQNTDKQKNESRCTFWQKHKLIAKTKYTKK